MNVLFLEVAQQELDEAIDYYNHESPELGITFLEEILSTLKLILNHPKAWASCSKRTRRCLTQNFPYGVIYQIKKTKILIIAISHLHRKPNYWKNRL